ncbi:hypothetical protein [Actinomadura madurae]|uniref:hypothetical protein n=1 Tax=Actinomadura madurae TaxID=1993 RepID=UPI0020D234DE|nr:hypothetical protein [Actinomadura madurae]MCP9971765.1 hypothetical protein [Actinomadura madurae]MCP9984268.1 hypothetical protein [Actinomadura madurae]
MNLTKKNGNGNGGRLGSGLSLDPLRTWWAGAPGWQRWAVYVLLIVAAVFLPSESIGTFMAPSGASWPSMLSDQIAIYVLLAIGLNVVVGMAACSTSGTWRSTRSAGTPSRSSRCGTTGASGRRWSWRSCSPRSPG